MAMADWFFNTTSGFLYHRSYGKDMDAQISKFWEIALECLLYSHISSVHFPGMFCNVALRRHKHSQF